MDAYWRAANYLSVGQLYLYDNPLLKKPLELSHVKPLVVGHWGTTPGQNFIYVRLNRVIKKYDLDMFYIAGPGHDGPALVGHTYLEGTYSEIYPDPDEMHQLIASALDDVTEGIRRIQGDARSTGDTTRPRWLDEELQAGRAVRCSPTAASSPTWPSRQRPNRTSPKETAIRTGRRRGPGRCRRGRRRWIG
jgi:phosphoketolase